MQFDEVKEESKLALIEIIQLTDWYENFLNSYADFEEECKRRRDYEIAQNLKAREYLRQFVIDFNEEVQKRNSFQVSEYLPEILTQILKTKMVKYAVRPDPFSLMKSSDRKES